MFEHPIEAIADSPVAAQEASLLRAAIQSANLTNREEVAEALAAFGVENPSSVWNPSLRANLGRYYCVEGHWTKALEQWERAWDSTKAYSTGSGKRTGDYTLAYWTRLLVELGRLDELQVIFAEAAGRRLDAGPLSQRYARSKEMYGLLRKRPELTYRCGWLVLNRLALASGRPALDASKLQDLYQERNLIQSCSMSVLAQTALSERWSLVGVERPEGSLEMPIPSVMHLKQGHYVALLRADGPLIWAYDPIFGFRHFRQSVLNAESSGRFLLNPSLVPSDFRALSAEEMLSTMGRSGGLGGFLDQPEGDCGECGCPGNQPGGPPGSKGGPGGITRGVIPGDEELWKGPASPGSSCGSCGGGAITMGMPRWWVTEPNINVWLRDVPISCQPAYGPTAGFDLQFKQRDERGYDRYIFSFGPCWNSHWLSYVELSRYGLEDLVVVFPGGGAVAPFPFAPGETVATNYHYNCKLTVTLSNQVPVAFLLDFPDGRRCVYEYPWQAGGYDRIYMSRSVDRQGFITQYNYTNVPGQYDEVFLQLSTVADHEGGTLFTLQYTNGTVYSSLVSAVTDRFGRSARLYYIEDSSGYSHLSRIEDAAGIPSTVTWDDWGWPQTFATPYGTTSFAYNPEPGQPDPFYRQVRVTDPNEGSEMYLFNADCANLWSGDPWMPTELAGGLVPENLPQGTLLDTSVRYLNSFYWNQAQNSGVPFELSQLTTNHMNKARMRHWLMYNYGEWYWPDLAPSFEVAPSQDAQGSELGQITFYDYAGKDPNLSYVRGTQIQPSLIARKLPDGSTWYTAYGRNSFGLVTSETSTYGTGNPASTRTYTYSYAGNDQNLTERRGPSNELLATYGYNDRHQMTNEVLWPDSITSYTNSWSYDAQGRLHSKTTAAGQTTDYTYGASSGSYSGYLSATSEEPVERNESFTWQDGMVCTHTDPRGLTVTHFWDNLGRLTGRLYPDGSTTTNLYSRATAYPYGTGGTDILDLTAAKDRLGHWTCLDYDGLRRITAKTNANGVVTRYGYCDCGSASYITNAWGTPVQQVTTYTFDNAGNRILESYADGYSVTNWFNALGQPIVSGDGTGYRWFFYNNQGLQTAVSNACGLESAITFDVNDRPEYSTDANGVTVVNVHDNLGRLLARGYPDDGSEWFGYTARGLVAYTNQLGYVTRYAYDEAGRKTYETNANTEVLRYTNSPAGDLLSLTDGKNQTTRWGYDEYGRVTNKLDQAAAEILRYKYDAEGRLTNRWSAAKGNTYYAYDWVGNLTNVNYPSSPDVAFRYDWLNRLTNMVDGSGTTKYTYTAGNQLLTEDGPFTSDTVTNIYSNRQRVALGLQQPTGVWTNGFGYDLARRLTNVTSQAGEFGYTYTALYNGYAARLVQQLALPNGACITNFYDPVARVLGTVLKNSGNSTLDAALYGYNEANQRMAYTNATGTNVLYSYDPIGQLLVANSSTNVEDRGYSYDSAWNLHYRTNNTTVSTYTVDGKNQLTNATGIGLMEYDLNGNLTNQQSAFLSYDYDDENRLAAAQVVWEEVGGVWHGWKSSFQYDGLGRLRWRLEFVIQAADGEYDWYFDHGVQYVYDGMRVIQERDEGSTPTVSYTRGSDLSGSLEGAGGIGGLLARSSGYSGGNWRTNLFYHADGNGNITCLIDTNQAVVASYRYDPFGNTISKSGTLADDNVYRFSSKEIHPASGMYYYGYRFYEPSLQRWLNRDPLRELGFRTLRHGRALSVIAERNLYAFVGNDPITGYDPLGLVHQVETDIESCLDNCLDDRNNAVLGSTARACKHHIWGHIIGAGGGTVCTLIACWQGGANLIVDLLAAGFDIFEAYEIVATVKEVDKTKAKAQSDFVTCCTGCGKKWKDKDEADQYIKDHPLK